MRVEVGPVGGDGGGLDVLGRQPDGPSHLRDEGAENASLASQRRLSGSGQRSGPAVMEPPGLTGRY
jgi:hypothetical protein